MGKTEFNVYSSYRSQLGNSSPVKNCAGCTKNCSKAQQLNDNEVEGLLPAGIKPESESKGITPDDIGKMQQWADENNMLLPGSFNQTIYKPTFERHYADEDNTNEVQPLIPPIR